MINRLFNKYQMVIRIKMVLRLMEWWPFMKS